MSSCLTIPCSCFSALLVFSQKIYSLISYKNIFVYQNYTLDRSRYDTNNTSTYSWKIAFRQLKFLQKGGSTYTRCRLIVGTIRYIFSNFLFISVSFSNTFFFENKHNIFTHIFVSILLFLNLRKLSSLTFNRLFPTFLLLFLDYSKFSTLCYYISLTKKQQNIKVNLSQIKINETARQ